MDNGHILSTFDNDLNRLNKDLLKLAKLATEQFVNSIDNFSTQNIEDIDKIIANDKNLDDLDEKIQQLGFEIIALRAPQAGDLRRVISALKIATIFERIGDYSRNISNRTKALIEISSDDTPGVNIGKMGLVTQEMLKKGFLAVNCVYACIKNSDEIIDEYLHNLDLVFRDIKEIDLKNSLNAENCLDGPVSHNGFKRLN